jgi:hypothetical protein
MDIEEDVERGESENVQTKNWKVEKTEKQIMRKNYMFKENFGEGIIEIFYVGHFIVWMMGKKLKLHPIKSWNVFYVMIMQ